MTLAQELHEEIQQIKIIDTHEHLVNRQMLSDMGFNIIHAMEIEYVKDSLLAVGIDPNLLVQGGFQTDNLLDQVIPVLWKVRNTSYYRSLFRAFRDLHGLQGEELDRRNLKRVSDSIESAYARRDWYEQVLQKKCNIRYILRDMEYMPIEHDFIRPVIRMDNFLMLRHRRLLQDWIERGAPIFTLRVSEYDYTNTVKTFTDYLDLLESHFQEAQTFGAIAVKVGIAYNRTLYFEQVSQDEAFRIFALPDEKTTESDIKAFQDFMMFRIIEKAAEYRLPVQIHTGLLSAGKNRLGNTNPLLLTDVFLQFPEVRFDLFHGGFPFTGETGALALMFPNVYLDTCWLPIISEMTFKRALKEWLCSVPASKILWGGDCACAEGTYGAVATMQEALAAVLAEKIEEDVLDFESAVWTAKGILHDNAEELFGLKAP